MCAEFVDLAVELLLHAGTLLLGTVELAFEITDNSVFIFDGLVQTLLIAICLLAEGSLELTESSLFVSVLVLKNVNSLPRLAEFFIHFSNFVIGLAYPIFKFFNLSHQLLVLVDEEMDFWQECLLKAYAFPPFLVHFCFEFFNFILIEFGFSCEVTNGSFSVFILFLKLFDVVCSFDESLLVFLEFAHEVCLSSFQFSDFFHEVVCTDLACPSILLHLIL